MKLSSGDLNLSSYCPYPTSICRVIIASSVCGGKWQIIISCYGWKKNNLSCKFKLEWIITYSYQIWFVVKVLWKYYKHIISLNNYFILLKYIFIFKVCGTHIVRKKNKIKYIYIYIYGKIQLTSLRFGCIIYIFLLLDV